MSGRWRRDDKRLASGRTGLQHAEAMSTTKLEPRREAHVMPWGELTPDQREAVQKAHGLFLAMANRKPASPPSAHRPALDRFLPRIDEERRNHVVLIDGERGTGKTAVMLRLLVDWSAAVRGTERLDGARAKAEKGEGPPLVGTDSPIVPAGLLDLQALSPKAVLGIHVAGHLQRVVEAMEQDAPRAAPRTPAPWAPVDSEELASRKAWRAFMRAAATAWEGNLAARQGKLDPEAYVVELEQAERERLDIREAFHAFVDALVNDYKTLISRRNEPPFFVITIDDADMNPQRTEEVFELIRLLWHPRVGFLVA